MKLHKEVTNMGRAEREGWNTWDRFIAAGAVENTLLWTDDPILVDNTIGRMKDKLRECWPIDAAVAYTLANHGEDASLTWADLVNQNTRIASVMMTGKVGYGLLTNPASSSCGHDEVDCYEMSLGEPFVRDGMIRFHNGSITHWDKYVKQNPRFMRPAEVDVLRGDSTKAREELGWTPKTTFEEMVSRMVANDIKLLS